MIYKAIFIDLDGTLLTDALTISPKTVEVLSRLSNSGILISIVTARSPAASLQFYDQLGITDNPIVCFNGALIQQENIILNELSIETDTLPDITALLNSFEVNVSMYRHHDWFTEKIDSWIEQEIEITKSLITKIRFDELFSKNFRPNKILCIGTPEKINAAAEAIHRSGFMDLNIHKSKTNYLEIMNKQASKKQGIQKVLEMYRIHKDEIITIGDNFNDIDMLSFSKTSIAMGNAPNEVKKYATFVTDTNNNDGIKKALDTLIKY